MTSKTALALILGITCLVASCASKPRGTSQNTYTGGEGRETAEAVGNRELERKLELYNVVSRRLEDDRLQVQFELHNKTQAGLAFEWQLVWMDAAGFKLDVPDRWTPVQLGGHEHEVLVATSPVPTAAVWKLGVRTKNAVR